MKNGTRAIIASCLLAVLLGACGGAPTTAKLFGTDVMADGDQSPIIAHNSPSLAQNPVQPTNIVVVDRVDRPDYTAGVHVSQDGGHTWRDAPLQLASGSKSKLFAPTAVYDTKGVLYILFVTLSGPGNNPDSMWIERSGDGGLTFDQPSMVAGPHTFQTTLAVDPKTGRLFAAWLQSDLEAQTCILCFAKTGIPIVVSHSDDGGHTWSPPAQVSDPGRARIGAPSLAIDANGNPSVVYFDYGNDRQDWEGLAGSYDGRFSLVITRSPDKGNRFQPGVVVDSDIVPIHRFLVYLPVAPAYAIANNGSMVVAWNDGRNGDSDILMRRSTNNGATWSAVVRVNQDAIRDGVSQDIPAVSIAPNGRIDVLYYDRSLDRRGVTADVMLSSSSDGHHFKTLRMSSQSSNRLVGPMGSPFETEADFGTRIALKSSDRSAIAAWTDSRNGTVDSGKQDIYSASATFPAASKVSGVALILIVLAILFGLAGLGLMLSTRRSARRGTPPPPPPLVPFDTPPPPPPLASSPGQV